MRSVPGFKIFQIPKKNWWDLLPAQLCSNLRRCVVSCVAGESKAVKRNCRSLFLLLIFPLSYQCNLLLAAKCNIPFLSFLQAPFLAKKNNQKSDTFFWFQPFAVLWMVCSFFWVILRGLNFMCGRFGTLCLFHLHTFLKKKFPHWHKFGGCLKWFVRPTWCNNYDLLMNQ